MCFPVSWRLRLFAAVLALWALACGGGGAGGDPVPARVAGRPSIVLISIDSLRADHVGTYGYERDTTPALDALARESIVFERAYTTMSWTLVAHMSLLTGMYPTQHRVWDASRALSPRIPTLAERLHGIGYHTLGFFNPEWLNPCFGFERGFDVYRPHASAREASEHLSRALAERPTDRPFFLFCHLYDVHTAPIDREDWAFYDPPAPYDRMYVEDARERLGEIDALGVWREQAPALPERQHEAVIALYDGCVRFVDDVIGEWIERWRSEGLLDDTVVIVTSDHGEGLGQHPGDRFGGHGDLFEEGLRVPFFIRFPDDRGAGERRADPVSHADLVPSLLEYLGLDGDTRLPGHSLFSPRPEDALIHAEDEHRTVLIGDRWKLVEERGGRDGALYDLESDPGEEASLRPRIGLEGFLEVAEPLREASRRERDDWFDPGPPLEIDPNEAMRARLRSLGYTDQ